MRLTARQSEVLKRLLRNGEFIHRCVHTSLKAAVTYFYNGSPAVVYIPRVTVRLLEKRRLIENFEQPDKRWLGSKYRITDAGREALRGQAPKEPK